jgi:hypothetical protein
MQRAKNTSMNPNLYLNKIGRGAFSLSITFILAYIYFKIFRSLDVSQTYSEFTVGNLAWDMGTKKKDILFFTSLPFFLYSSFIVSNSFYKKFFDHFNFFSRERGIDFFVYFSPFLIFLPFLAINSFGVVLLILITFFFSCFISDRLQNREVNWLLTSGSLVAVFILSFLPVALLLIYSRLGVSNLAISSIKMNHYVFILLLLISSLIGYCWFRKLLSKRLPLIIVLSQIPLAFLFFHLIPQKVMTPDGFVSYGHNLGLYILAISLACSCLISLYSVYKKNSSPMVSMREFSKLISPFAVFSVISLLIGGTTNIPIVSSDDYHFGERLLGGWAYFQGLVPYLDYFPPHGVLYDDLVCLVSNIFYDGTAASFNEASRITFFIISGLFFSSVYIFSKSLLLSSLVLLGLYWLRIDFLFLGSFLFLFLNIDLRRKPVIWLSVLCVTAPLILLCSPAHGLIMLASVFPIFLICLRDAWLSLEPKERVWFFCFVLFVTFVVFVFTPFYNMFFNIFKYVLANGSINQVAYGIPYERSLSHLNIFIEVRRISWVVFSTFFIWLLVDRKREIWKAGSVFYCALSGVLFIFLHIPYSMGRIDPGGFSRTGNISAIASGVFFTILIFSMFDSRNKRAFSLFGLCIIFSIFSRGNLWRSIYRSIDGHVPSPPISKMSSSLREAAGFGVFNPKQLKRLEAIKSVLDEHLTKGERYLDLTSRNAHYFYFQRLPPLPITAPYNLVSETQQLEAINILKKDLPKIALLYGDNIIHDGGGIALRSPYFNDFILKNYVPVKENGYIFGHKSERGIFNKNLTAISVQIKSLRESDNKVLFSFSDDGLLKFVGTKGELVSSSGKLFNFVSVSENVFSVNSNSFLDFETKLITLRLSNEKIKGYHLSLVETYYPHDLRGIPSSWGESRKSLSKKLSQEFEMKNHSNQRDSKNGVIEIELEKNKEIPKNADYLGLELYCEGKIGSPKALLSWKSNASNDSSFQFEFNLFSSKLLIPLHIAPRWLLASDLKGFKIELMNKNSCKDFGWRNLTLNKGFLLN